MTVISGGDLQGWYDRGKNAGIMYIFDFALFGLGAAALAMLRRARKHFDEEVFLRLTLSIMFVVVSGVSEGLGMRGFDSFFLFGICSRPCRFTLSTRR